MESDDDYQSFSPPEEPSPPVRHRRLKRLKKAIGVSDDPPAESLSLPPSDSIESQVPKSSNVPGYEELGGPLRSQSPSQGFDVDNELDSGVDGLNFGEVRKETKRALDFDDMGDGFEGKSSNQCNEMEDNMPDLKMERSEKRQLDQEESTADDKENKKKRVKRSGDDAKPKASSSNKRREERDRKIYVQQLHVESQRLLRETRDATFKPIPIVQKPISSVLEKIRQRKLEVLKKTVSLNSNCSFDENNDSLREDIITHQDSENISNKEKDDDKSEEVMMQEETIARHVDVDTSLDASHVDANKKTATQLSHEDCPSQTITQASDEQAVHAFRAPVDDTQDLFIDSQTSEGKDEISNDLDYGHLEEVLAPSLLVMNLKLDSAPPDDLSDEEDNDKENVDPDPDRVDNGCSSPRGDPVKAFVDEEAVEEDDSDNDLLRFQEDEDDEENEDDEEFNDLIATEYEEKPIDNERRNELHQKWLEQQDAAGTDNLLQRLKCGSKLKDTTLLEEEEEEHKEYGDETAEDPAKTSVAQLNSRKAKQMIPQMFSEKNDGYLSSDEEEAENRLFKQCLLNKVEEQGALMPLVENESSREVLGLIKKLNIVPDAKKKTKASSFFDKMLTGGDKNGSSKSSFLGRAPSHSLPSSYRQGTSTVRSFIFGRDDSNSRSSISTTEDSSDVIPKENRPTRNAASKFSSSQSKFSTQSTKNAAAETVTGASLFEILKRSSIQSNACNQDNTVGLSQTAFAAFKIPKKPIKVEGRT